MMIHLLAATSAPSSIPVDLLSQAQQNQSTEYLYGYGF